MATETPDLRRLNAAFEETRAQYLHEIGRGAPSREMTEKLYAGAYIVMTAYCHQSNWPEGINGNPIQPFPPLLATLVRLQIRAIIGGDISGPLRDLLRRGSERYQPD